MATATLERDGTQVTIPLITNGGGTPLVGRGIGKPNLNIQNTGAINPRFVDQWSQTIQYQILGRFTSDTAYSDAIELADLIKSNGDGSPITLNIDMGEFDTNISVVPAAGQEQALQLVYPPGNTNRVDIDLGLTRVSNVVNGGDQPATTPTDAGTGPIQITDGVDVVDLVQDVEVTRTVGRPESVVRRSTSDFPYYVDKFKAAYDQFEIRTQYTDNTVSTVNDLVDIFNQQLGRDAITLDFNGIFGMGEIDVTPSGANALRLVRPSGMGETNLVPTIQLRRVLTN